MGSLSSIVFNMITAGYPIFIVIFLTMNKEKLANKDFQERFDALYEGLRLDSNWSLYYNVFFLLRRLI
jgi:hypothetical protein